MTKLIFPLNITLFSPRPIFKACINGVPFRCMLDTGADIPVFCKGTALFREMVREMQGVTVTEFKQSSIGGFGKTNESTMLWNMDKFVLSDQNEDITYKAMKIAVMDKPKIPCDLILSASMLMKMQYTIDCSTDKHVLTIVADRSTYGVGYYDKRETIYIFTDNAK